MTSTAPRPRLDAGDADLLRTFEPVVRYTRGETFLPMSVATYLRFAARMRSDGRADEMLGAPGTVSAEGLTDGTGDLAAVRDYLTVAGTGNDDDVEALFRTDNRQAVGFRHFGGRLARVGYAARLVDALFSISLLARGRVPGSLARRSVERYHAMAAEDESTPYYGRVVRTATWTALQYWFFYAFNDWRSGFNGANDHEADWEQVLVYLDADADGRAVPRWAAYAQHDYHGRDLRRRWDDASELELIGDHPVVYSGAGSHASYFRPGEYLAEQELKMPPFVRRIAAAFSRLMAGPGDDGGDQIFSIAFVDFARGDGVSVGPGGDREWTPVLIDESQAWASRYSGLWGLSVQDPFQGEDAPAGPMFNRDRSVRLAWANPVAFAELDLEPPPSQAPQLLASRAAAIERRQQELATEITALERELAATGAEVGDLVASLAEASPSGAERLGRRHVLIGLHHEREENELRLMDVRRRLASVQSGWEPGAQAHLRRVPVPRAPGADRAGLLLETWAAVSIGLLLIALVAALVLAPRFGLIAAVAVIALFLFVESILRGRVGALMIWWVRLMAVLATAVLVVRFWQAGIIAAAVAAGLFVIRENVAELLAAAQQKE